MFRAMTENQKVTSNSRTSVKGFDARSDCAPAVLGNPWPLSHGLQQRHAFEFPRLANSVRTAPAMGAQAGKLYLGEFGAMMFECKPGIGQAPRGRRHHETKELQGGHPLQLAPRA